MATKEGHATVPEALGKAPQRRGHWVNGSRPGERVWRRWAFQPKGKENAKAGR